MEENNISISFNDLINRLVQTNDILPDDNVNPIDWSKNDYLIVKSYLIVLKDQLGIDMFSNWANEHISYILNKFFNNQCNRKTSMHVVRLFRDHLVCYIDGSLLRFLREYIRRYPKDCLLFLNDFLEPKESPYEPERFGCHKRELMEMLIDIMNIHYDDPSVQHFALVVMFKFLEHNVKPLVFSFDFTNAFMIIFQVMKFHPEYEFFHSEDRWIKKMDVWDIFLNSWDNDYIEEHFSTNRNSFLEIAKLTLQAVENNFSSNKMRWYLYFILKCTVLYMDKSDALLIQNDCVKFLLRILQTHHRPGGKMIDEYEYQKAVCLSLDFFMR